MAVPKSKRSQTTLTVLTETDMLVCYTIRLCTNEQRFPKRYRWCLTKDIAESAVHLKMQIARANSVYVNDIESWNLRRTYQQKAIAEIAALAAGMDTAFKLFAGLRNTREADKPNKAINVIHWTAQLNKVKTLLLAWKKSDTAKYKF